YFPKVRPVNRSLRRGKRSRIAMRFRNGRPCGDRYEHRHDKNRCEDKFKLLRFRCHSPLLGSDSELSLYGRTGEKSVTPVTLWSNRRKLYPYGAAPGHASDPRERRTR